MKQELFSCTQLESIGLSICGVFGSHSGPKFSLFCCHPPLPELSHLSCVFSIVSAFEKVS